MNLSAAPPAAGLAVFRDFDALHLSAYALLSIAGILAALWLSLRTARLRALAPEALWDAGFFAVVAAFVISRALGFLLLLAVEHGRLTLSFREVLGFSSISYLSLTVTAIAVAAWLRWKRLPLLRVMDAWAPCGALLWSALSLAGASSGMGDGLPTRLPWGVRVGSSGGRVHPVALYTAAAALVLCGGLFSMLKRVRIAGRVAGVALAAAGTIVFLLDMLRMPGHPLAHDLLDTSQWIALAGIVVGGCIVAIAPRARQQEAR